jgi:hypothetical protein
VSKILYSLFTCLICATVHHIAFNLANSFCRSRSFHHIPLQISGAAPRYLFNLLTLQQIQSYNSKTPHKHNSFSMLSGSLVITAWRVLGLLKERTATKYGTFLRIYCIAVADSRQDVVLQIGGWMWN